MRICPHCNTQNADTARFCSICGEDLTLLAPGTYLAGNRYCVSRLLGKGGMGAVYLAYDVQEKRPCAVKEMLDRFANSAERAEAASSFQREVEILKGLYHLSIPEFYDTFTEARNRHYLVMEYIDGQNMEQGLTHYDGHGQLVRGGPMPWQQVVKYAIQICDVLTCLHSQHPDPIVYRDLKPSNVVVSRDGRRLVLTDFGIARFFVPHTRGTAIGTQGYVPPEQFAGVVEPRSDLYALASTMYHLLTDDDPRGRQTPFNLPRIRSHDGRLPVWLDEIVETNLRTEITERYDSAEEVREALMHQKPRETVCPRCGRPSPPGRPYCDDPGCGYPLSRKTVTCPRCGTANVINSKFCIHCGALL